MLSGSRTRDDDNIAQPDLRERSAFVKLATFTQDGRTRLGVVEGAEIVDICTGSGLPNDMTEFLAGTNALEAARKAAETSKQRFPLSAIKLEAPVPRPRKFLGIGGSYRSHLEEIAHLGMKPPKYQVWFNKQVTCVNGPYDNIHFPRVSETLDYEAELAIVIGKKCRHLSGADARGAIAGFTICNDVSVREWQLLSPTATLGKSFDTHGPTGPWIVTPDELTNVHDLSIKTWVNGELRQNGRTSDMVYRFGEMLVELSTVFTLEPGDILSTGSPAGVGGVMQPPRYMSVGDVCRIEIEGIGHIENRIVAEP